MKLYCEGLDLSDAVLKVIKAASNKTTNPILEGIKLVAEDETLTLLATDGELAIEKKIKADVKIEGQTVVPGKLFSEFVKKLSGEQIELSLNEANQLKLKYTDSEVYMQCLNASEFPVIQQINSAQFFTIKQNDLKDLIEKTIFCVALDDTRPILKGCLIEAKDKEIKSIALDGYRMAIAKKSIVDCSADISVVVPGRSLSELSKLVDDGEDTIRILVQQNYLMAEVNSTKIMTRLLGTGADYINYNQIIPTDSKTEVVIQKSQLEDALERVSILARASNDNSANFDFRENLLVLQAKADIGNVTEKVNISHTGEDLLISFDNFFVKESLSAIKDDFIKLKLNGPVNPCVIVPHTGDEYLYLILPIRQMR
ncbi:MAG: DNA polymerase III subunit beta [Clostridiales bacterium]|nr:DNA polymerase III subunit beta [Candidatus Apopatousia equi]